MSNLDDVELETLFDLEAPVRRTDRAELEDAEVQALGLTEADTWPVWLYLLHDDDRASTSCRHCRTATTAAGIRNRGHGADSVTCTRWADR